MHLLPFLVSASSITLTSVSAIPSQPQPPHPPNPPSPPKHFPKTHISCPIIFDGRVQQNLTLQSFDSAETSPFSPKYVKGENLTWSQILLFPDLLHPRLHLPSQPNPPNKNGNKKPQPPSRISVPPSRFDDPGQHKPVEVTINDSSLFRAGTNLQTGFRRAGLLLKTDTNPVDSDAADRGVVTFHWSVYQDASRPLNLSHEYMNVWHERADYNGNQFSFVAGVVLDVDGGNQTGGIGKEAKMWKVQDRGNRFVWGIGMEEAMWQNFAVRLDYGDSTLQVFYSSGNAPLKAVTQPLPNDNSGGGQLQIGIAKKPTETKTVVYDGYQESMPHGEGQIYGGIFVEDSSGGCVSV